MINFFFNNLCDNGCVFVATYLSLWKLVRNDSITSDLRCMKTADPSPWCISPCNVNEIILLSTVLSIVEEQSSSSERRFAVDSGKVLEPLPSFPD